MNLAAVVALRMKAYGTSEGVTKAWDTRGRGRISVGGVNYDSVWGDWGAPSGKYDGMISGWHANSGLRGRGNTEGDGLYVAKEPELAHQFGNEKQLYFSQPKKVLNVDEEPLHLLHETEEITQPIKSNDSEWTRLNKQAYINTQKTSGGEPDAVQVGHELTRLMKNAGYDAVRVKSGGEEWAVLLDKSLIKRMNAIGVEGAGQTDSSSLIGRKYRVVDTKYGFTMSEYDNPEEAEHAAQARPYSKVMSEPNPAQTPEVRDIARRRLVQTNPDVT